MKKVIGVLGVLALLLFPNAGKPAYAANDLLVSIESVGTNNRISPDGAQVVVNFAGTATTKFNTCADLVNGLQDRFDFEFELEAKKYKTYIYGDSIKLVSASADALKCIMSVSPNLSSNTTTYTAVMPSKLIAIVDGVVTDTKSIEYKPGGLNAPAPRIISPNRAQIVNLTFDVTLDSVSDLNEYRYLLLGVCPVAQTSCSKTYIHDNTSRKSTPLGTKVAINENVFATAKTPELINVIVGKSGQYRLLVERVYNYSTSGNNFSVQSEVVISAQGSGMEDPNKYIKLSDLSDYEVDKSITCGEADEYGDEEVSPGEKISCELYFGTKPVIAGKMKAKIYTAYNGGKPKFQKNAVLQIGSGNHVQMVASKASTAKYLRVYLVLDGEKISTKEYSQIDIYRPAVKDPRTVLAVNASGPSTVAWGEVMRISVQTSPAASGICTYYLGNGILSGQSKLTKGRASTSVKALFTGNVGSRTTFSITVKCASGVRTGTDYIIVSGYR